jgi:hypothetical protein
MQYDDPGPQMSAGPQHHVEIALAVLPDERA